MTTTTPHSAPITDPYSRYSSEVSGNDIDLIFKILMDRKKTIFGCMVLVVFMSLLYLTQVQTTYTATTKVMVNATDTTLKRSNVLQTLFRTGRIDAADLLSQIQVMKSPDVIEQLIKDQALYKNPDFGGAPEFESFEVMPETRQMAMVSRIASGLSISPVLGTSIVEISFETRNPIDAAMIANAHPKAYAANEELRAKEQALRASQWLAERLKVLQEDVRKAEMALENAREENNLTLSQNNDIRIQQIDLLTRELSTVEAEYAETQAILELIKTARENNRRLDAIPKFLTDRLAENLKMMEANLERKRALYENKYGQNHPEMIALRAEVAAFRDKLNEEVAIFAESLENQKDIQLAKIREINNKIVEYRDSYKGDSEKRLRIRNLQTQANTSRTLLNNFMGSYLESIQSLNIDQNPVRVIMPATVPTSNSAVSRMLIIVLSAVTGLFLGVFIALVMERIEDSIQTGSQLENLTHLPVYASLPFVKMARDQTAADYLHTHPASVLAELMRTLLTTMLFRNPHHKSGGRVITVTSTHTNEGKTTTAIWLATTAAHVGKRVLIIDADMRRPSLHKAFGIGNKKGLADYLSNRLPLDDTIYKRDGSNVHVMTSKAIPTHALTLLTSERMETLIRRVRDDYDLVILDAPTAHVFSDSLVCAKMSDKALFVVEWKRTKRDDIRNTLKQFTDLQYRDIALVLNKVNEKQILKIRKEDIAYMGHHATL